MNQYINKIKIFFYNKSFLFSTNEKVNKISTYCYIFSSREMDIFLTMSVNQGDGLGPCPSLKACSHITIKTNLKCPNKLQPPQWPLPLGK